MSHSDSKYDKFSDAWKGSPKQGKPQGDSWGKQSQYKQSETKWSGDQLKNAVVGISSEILLFSNGLTPGFTGAPSAYTSYFLNGNGSLLKGNVILCPAALVLIPQPVLSTLVRYPLVNPSAPFPTGLQNVQTKVSRILVTVYNVNCCGKALVYEASLIGVDGAGNAALLYIDPKKQWNTKCPCLGPNQPYFRWGDSRKLCPGSRVYLVGSAYSEPQDNLMPSGDQYVVEGTAAANRSVDTTGWNPQELVVVNAPVYTLAIGLPILDSCYNLVGMQTTSVVGASQVFGGSSGFTGDGKVSGPSQFWLCPVISALLAGPRSCNNQTRVLTVNDATGSYSSYQKAYLGLVWKLFTATDYDTVYGASNNSYQVPLGLTSGAFQVPSSCDIKVGLRVQALAGDTSFYQLPGASGASFLPNSPLLNVVSPGDQILSFQDCPLGNLPGQISGGVVTWKACPGDQIDVAYRKQIDGFTACYSLNVTGATYPPYLDFPWASAVWWSHSTGLTPVFPSPTFKDGI